MNFTKEADIDFVRFGVIASMLHSNSPCSAFKWYGSIGCVFVVAAADMFLAYRGVSNYLLNCVKCLFISQFMHSAERIKAYLFF